MIDFFIFLFIYLFIYFVISLWEFALDSIIHLNCFQLHDVVFLPQQFFLFSFVSFLFPPFFFPFFSVFLFFSVAPVFHVACRVKHIQYVPVFSSLQLRHEQNVDAAQEATRSSSGAAAGPNGASFKAITNGAIPKKSPKKP